MTSTAREQALAVFPAAFAQEDEADVVVARWVDGRGATLVEIGFERDTSELLDRDAVSPDDVPWVADGDQRDRGDRREEMHGLFRRALRQRRLHFVEVSGSHEQRMTCAITAIDALAVE